MFQNFKVSYLERKKNKDNIAQLLHYKIMLFTLIERILSDVEITEYDS